jgi:hypothetical protein
MPGGDVTAVILVVDNDPASLDVLADELRTRYGRGYAVDGFGVLQPNPAWSTIFTISCADVV